MKVVDGYIFTLPLKSSTTERRKISSGYEQLHTSKPLSEILHKQTTIQVTWSTEFIINSHCIFTSLFSPPSHLGSSKMETFGFPSFHSVFLIYSFSSSFLLFSFCFHTLSHTVFISLLYCILSLISTECQPCAGPFQMEVILRKGQSGSRTVKSSRCEEWGQDPDYAGPCGHGTQWQVAR